MLRPRTRPRALPAWDDAGCTLQAAAACNDCFQRPLAFKFLAFFTRFLGWCGTDIDSVQEIDSLRHADPTGNATTHPHRRPIPRPTCVGRGICRVATARDLGKIWVSGFGPWEPAAASSTLRYLKGKGRTHYLQPIQPPLRSRAPERKVYALAKEERQWRGAVKH